MRGHSIAPLYPACSTVALLHHFLATCHSNVEIADFLAKRVPVDAQKLGRADLVAARRGKGQGDQRQFHLLENLHLFLQKQISLIEIFPFI